MGGNVADFCPTDLALLWSLRAFGQDVDEARSGGL